MYTHSEGPCSNFPHPATGDAEVCAASPPPQPQPPRPADVNKHGYQVAEAHIALTSSIVPLQTLPVKGFAIIMERQSSLSLHSRVKWELCVGDEGGGGA